MMFYMTNTQATKAAKTAAAYRAQGYTVLMNKNGNGLVATRTAEAHTLIAMSFAGVIAAEQAWSLDDAAKFQAARDRLI